MVYSENFQLINMRIENNLFWQVLRKKAEEEDRALNGVFYKMGQHSISKLPWRLKYIKHVVYPCTLGVYVYVVNVPGDF